MNEVKQPKRPLIYYYGLMLLLLMLFNFLFMPWLTKRQIHEVDYNTFVTMTENLVLLGAGNKQLLMYATFLLMAAAAVGIFFLRRGVQPHVCAVAEWNGNPNDSPAWSDGQRRAARMLRETFRDAKEFGSILSIPKPLADALDALGENPFGGETALGVDAENLQRLAAQAKIMARKYDVVVTNPPYMGSSGMGAKLAEFVKKWYPDSKSDLFAVFMERGREYTQMGGYCCMVTMQSWMFLSSFEKLRGTIMKNQTITTLMHMENMVLGIAFGTAVSVLKNEHIAGYKGTYNHIKLEDIEDGEPKDFPIKGNRFAQVSSENFEKIPGAPVAYWVSEKVYSIFQNEPNLGSIAPTKMGMTTGENNRFLRFWYEIKKEKIGNKYQFYNKGGEYRRWFGNIEYVINWENDGYEVRNFKGSTIRNDGYYFKKSISWSLITSSMSSFRSTGKYKCVFGDAGPGCFPDDEIYLYIIACLNTKIVDGFLSIINPTINLSSGVASLVPIAMDESKHSEIDEVAKEQVELSMKDWDSFETSWDFKKHPMI